MEEPICCLRLHGTFSCTLRDGEMLILGSKQQALIALLATSSDGVRTRSFLQSTLWSLVTHEQAAASLRTALSAIRKALGDHADILASNRERIWLDLDQVQILQPDAAKTFLEGLDLRGEEAWEDWLRLEREKQFVSPSKSETIQNEIGQAPPEFDQLNLNILPSIAVLPFVNRSTESHKDVLGHLVSEQITRTLSKNSSFSVISHLSTRNFNSPFLTADQISKKLGAKFLITGSFSLSGRLVRFEIDLHSLRTQRVLWSRTFMAPLDELLSGESDVVNNVASTAYRSVAKESVQLAETKPLSNLECHELLMGGIAMMQSPNFHKFTKAGEMLTEVVEREPKHPVPLAWLANWHAMLVNKGYSLNITNDYNQAEEMTDRALSLDPQCAFALAVRGLVATFGHHDLSNAKVLLDSAIDMNPNESLAHLHRATASAFDDDAQRALKHAEKALALSPLDPQLYFFKSLAATAYLAADNLTKALEFAEASFELNRRHPSTLRVRTIALQKLGRGEEAYASLKELRRIEPQLTVSSYLSRHPSGNSRSGKDWADALRDAGLPN